MFVGTVALHYGRREQDYGLVSVVGVIDDATPYFVPAGYASYDVLFVFQRNLLVTFSRSS